MFDQKLDNGPQGGEANDWKDLKFIIAKSAILFIRRPINRGGHTGPRKKIQLFLGSNPKGS